MGRINGFQAYQIYNALRLHYSSENYNAYQYNFKSNVSIDSFEKRRDKYFFHRLAKKHTIDSIKDFYHANFIEGKKWIGEMEEKYYNERQSRLESLTYRFKTDINKLSDYGFNELCTCREGQNELLNRLDRGDINIETVAIIDKLVNFIKPLLPLLNDPLHMKKEKAMMVMKYKESLININREKIKDIILLSFTKEKSVI
jgi:hypothetical protein